MVTYIIFQFRPCGDDDPVMDAEGRPVDCGGGPQRKDCPVGSYCHHTTKAARCCRKGMCSHNTCMCNIYLPKAARYCQMGMCSSHTRV